MAHRSEKAPLTFDCPLCGHELLASPETEGMCTHCGAELAFFLDENQANQFAETRKGWEESVRWKMVNNSPYWVVAHKANPPGQMAA